MSRGRPRTSTAVRTTNGWKVSAPAQTGSTRRVQHTFASKSHALAWQKAAYAALDAGQPLPGRDSVNTVVPTELGTAATTPVRGGRTPSFVKVADAYITENYLQLGRAGQGRVDTIRGYVRNHYVPLLNHYHVHSGSDLTRAAYVAWLAGLVDGSRPAIQPKYPSGIVTIEEAITATGASLSTLKRRIGDGSLPNSYIDQRGRRQIPLTDLAAAGLLTPAPLRRGPRSSACGFAPGFIEDLRAVLDDILQYGVDTAGWTLQFDPGTVRNPRNAHYQVRRAQASLADCRTIAPHLHVVHQVAMWLMRVLGLRISEAYGIRVVDVIDDGRDGIIRVHRQGGRTFRDKDANGQPVTTAHSDTLKTRTSLRALPVPASLMVLIRTVIEVFHTDESGQVRTDARLIPSLNREGAGGQSAFRSALKLAATAAEVNVSGDWDEDTFLLPVPKDFRTGNVSDMAWNDVPEIHRKRFSGHAAGSDVHSRVYILDSPDMVHLAQAADVLEALINESCPDGLMIPTTVSCTMGTQQMLHAHKDVLDAKLTDIGWLTTAVTADGHSVLSIEEAADMLNVSRQTVRRLVQDGRIIETARDTKRNILVTVESVMDVVNQRRGQRLLADVAADLGIPYMRAWALVRQYGLDVDQDGAGAHMAVPAATEQRLVELVAEQNALYERSVRITDAAEQLAITVRAVEALIKARLLTVDAQRGPHGARFVTRESVAAQAVAGRTSVR